MINIINTLQLVVFKFLIFFNMHLNHKLIPQGKYCGLRTVW